MHQLSQTSKYSQELTAILRYWSLESSCTHAAIITEQKGVQGITAIGMIAILNYWSLGTDLAAQTPIQKPPMSSVNACRISIRYRRNHYQDVPNLEPQALRVDNLKMNVIAHTRSTCVQAQAKESTRWREWSSSARDLAKQCDPKMDQSQNHNHGRIIESSTRGRTIAT